ncbi:MAG TPA: AbrB/MazE/SpoVT family DNA-binding domain-containing protein [Chloroflexota bacterium]|nr:AbrB/MazE/SpoVT family DNA-binding domain-containing protein [Chloroflexota bacterium]
MAEPESTRRIVRSLRGGQITIPSEFRKRLGIEDNMLLQVTIQDGELRIRPVRDAATVAGSPWLKELYDLFAPVREEAAQFSDEEINAAVATAVKAVRRKRA